MLLNSVWLLNTQKSIPKRQLLVKVKLLLIRMLAIWGEDGVMSPPNQLPRFCSARKVLKGKGGLILVNHGDRGSDWLLFPTVCRLINFS